MCTLLWLVLDSSFEIIMDFILSNLGYLILTNSNLSCCSCSTVWGCICSASLNGSICHSLVICDLAAASALTCTLPWSGWSSHIHHTFCHREGNVSWSALFHSICNFLLTSDIPYYDNEGISYATFRHQGISCTLYTGLMPWLPYVTKYGWQSGQHHGPSHLSSAFLRKVIFNCQNYQTISLISHPSKVLLKVLLNRLQPQVEEILDEEQAGFRADRSTIEQIFNLQILSANFCNPNVTYTAFSLISRKHLIGANMMPHGQLLGNITLQTIW